MTRTGVREIASVTRVLAGGRLGRYARIGGGRTARFEAEAAAFLDSPHTLAVNSGTSALVCALVGVGIGPGDEVLVPAYTWVSTAAAVLTLGAVPVLVEIDESLTISPADLAAKITPATKAVIPVHMNNLVCDMEAITSLAEAHGIAVVEDACQAFGVRYRGRRLGTLGDAGAFSFSQAKNISSGEGGLVAARTERTAVRAAMFHDVGSYTRAGWAPTDEPLFVGMNLKMSELTAAVLLPQLRRLDPELDRLLVHRRAAVEEMASEKSLRVSPHHDPEHAIGLTVMFDDPADAAMFARQRGVQRLIDMGRHVHLNWESVRSRRTFHDAFDPYAWAGHRDGAIEPSTCPATPEILARSCRIRLMAHVPLAVTRAYARRLAGYRRAAPLA